MVFSELKPSISYGEEQAVSENDYGLDTDIYEFTIFNKTIQVVIGKEDNKYIHRGLLSYSLYAINRGKIRARIGVIEVDIKKLKIYDVKHKTPDFTLHTPILFSFVNSALIDKLAPTEKFGGDNAEDDEADTMFSRYRTKTPTDSETEVAVLPTGVFIDTDFKMSPLKEESELDARNIRAKYIDDKTGTWIQQFMKNPHYEIEYNVGNGDCFFYVIVQAFNQIGKETTVTKLRNLLSKEATEDIFTENRTLYEDIRKNEDGLRTQIKTLRAQFKKSKIYLDAVTLELRSMGTQKEQEAYVKTHKQKINEETKSRDSLEKKIKELEKELEMETETAELIGNEMHGITTFEEFREYIKTPKYWADTWAISTFEWLLNIKFIILNSSKYPDSINEIVECGEVNRNIGGVFRPTHYIITTYNGEHYELVLYKKKGIFEFRELPYDIRILIVNKCMEKNAGIFNKIEEFRLFETRLGIDPNANGDLVVREDHKGLYDNTVIFMFYAKSSNVSKAGKGTNEKIPADKIKDYIPLGKIADWRRKLDDSWMDTDHPFILDSHKWASVAHFVWGMAFKEKYPEKYAIFALDSGNAVAKSYDVAKKLYDKELPLLGNMPVSQDSLSTWRESALRAKFMRPEMGDLLRATRKATLLHYEPNSKPKEDILLMFVRKELLNDSGSP